MNLVQAIIRLCPEAKLELPAPEVFCLILRWCVNRTLLASSKQCCLSEYNTPSILSAEEQTGSGTPAMDHCNDASRGSAKITVSLILDDFYWRTRRLGPCRYWPRSWQQEIIQDCLVNHSRLCAEASLVCRVKYLIFPGMVYWSWICLEVSAP